jgi:peptide/nickel transport system ATP-binding protein
MTEAPLLVVEDLHVDFATPKGLVEAVRGVTFTLGREKLGIVGESGSGKSVTGRSILKLIPPPGRVRAKRLEFNGADLLGADERAMRKVRGEGISMVMQDPKFSLNPVMTVGAQIAEAYRIHAGASAAEAKRRSLEMLATVRIRDPERVYRAYPHEVSGGMGQRIMIAMMLIPDPDILIADEPTSALDVTVQLQVLAIMDDLVTQRGMGLIFSWRSARLPSWRKPAIHTPRGCSTACRGSRAVARAFRCSIATRPGWSRTRDRGRGSQRLLWARARARARRGPRGARRLLQCGRWRELRAGR